ncbi:MAG: hypothetical protein K2K46_05855, partial [Lachnospiraceae bacterium]|nr:hypothetical protein [Lachnospiraceae bacterium]
DKGGGLRTRKTEVRVKGYRLKARFRSVKNAAVLRILYKLTSTNEFAAGSLSKIQVPAFLEGLSIGNSFPPPAHPGVSQPLGIVHIVKWR